MRHRELPNGDRLVSGRWTGRKCQVETDGQHRDGHRAHEQSHRKWS
jgi:hypothetical protein